MSANDDDFFKRADEHINVANEQLASNSRGAVSASMMYSVARFNAWLSACEFKSAAEMATSKERTLKYFVAQYEKMLKENLEDYITHFDKYMKAAE
ncbi:MAG TPA: DUF3144 domain-containing protein [Saprospiraceae bacterium]|nr:DUF3144 domain-containing protein [Saprospiraceae bacterium]